MKPCDGLATLAWMVRDTFRQSLASGIGWLLAGLSTLCILVCLSVSAAGPAWPAPPGEKPDFLPRSDADAQDAHKLQQSGVKVADGPLRLAFGAVRVPMARDVPSAVHFLELVLAGGVADTLGLLLALVWTAGFLPGFLDSRAISVLRAKPVPRWALLLGKYFGVVTFVLTQAAYFVVGTWLALGLRTDVWDATYLLTIPLLLLHFAIFFSFSLLLAVWTRSAVVCVFGSIAFWGVCWAINFARMMLVAAAQVAPQGSFSAWLAWLAEAGYWLLPKPIDLGRLLFDALGAGTDFRPVLNSTDTLSLGLSVLTSLAFTVLVLFAAARHWTRMDY
ncbi:MAG: ABC transporter permease subunit [Thermoguttaceae bacterium]|jgi:ABC-type transport system involved in multi-copper enzyme maturation permease subunit